jgi:hypothetical protein
MADTSLETLIPALRAAYANVGKGQYGSVSDILPMRSPQPPLKRGAL